ncbi:component of SufBCD complex [Rhodovulum sp. 12E13]|uniref:component of SufBCD complex n=1 Tax=Rhodovulum sp. 12E13 TaxID=2203891 RepID=UPI000E14ABE8|nr:component of SufBCD complex [Rhodovulum sp. 12E13]RDC73136.1 component of SufBCD complex [Rhodovulum sp. 12E13]
MQELYRTVTEVIDLRSFSNLWFWIALAVVWSTASHYVLGVPYDMITRARRDGGEAEEDLRDMVRVNVNRLLHIAESAGLWLLALACFALTTLAIVGFVYGIEFAQALFLLGFPLSIVFALSLRTARRIRAADGEGLHRVLVRHRLSVQAVGVVSIFVTAMWGMWQNMVIGPI